MEATGVSQNEVGTGKPIHPAASERCRAKFEQARATATHLDAFYWGVIVGYAEKLSLGACRGCMLRPELEVRSLLVPLLDAVCDIYPLAWRQVGDEFWLGLADDLDAALSTWAHAERESPDWHIGRGRMVGVPTQHIDPAYHLR